MKDGLIRMVSIGVSAAIALSCTYFVPQLHDYRPWLESDALPFAMWFSDDTEAVAALPEFGASSQLATQNNTDEAPETGLSTQLLPEPVSDPGATNDESKDELPTPEQPEIAPTKPAEKEELKKAEPKVVISPREFEGITQEFEDPSGKALDHFYESLQATALKKKQTVTRITHYGASVIGADGMTSIARRKLQARFGYAGKGWVNMTAGWKWYRQKDVVFRDKGWKSRVITQGALKNGHYGYGGVAALSWGGALSSYKVHADTLELYYLKHKGGGDVLLKVEGGAEKLINTRSETSEDAHETIKAEGKGPHKFIVRAKGKGQAHLYGVTLESSGPGVVYDCLGMIGTRASRILNYDEAHLKQTVAYRKPNLQIIMYGGNELADRRMNLRVYEKKYRNVIQRIRSGRPEGSCVIMTPVDHGERVRGRVKTVPLLKKVITIQQRIAKDFGCGFFNTWKAMGGEGAMGRWYRAKPRLAWGDYAHLTRDGDRVMGAMIYKAIMKGFSDWLAKKESTPKMAP
ncbi:MAG TPA: hypothetical protein EYN06_10605 [Myxococcales bacterium]|nr:hypothetical protein [Myxococcales bacterium]HIN86923.1 hypothetical protein [Myxococcales bacterium]